MWSVIAVVIVGLVGIYALVIRPWQVRWGATDDEVQRAMRGDDLVQKPNFVATRAITINARPEEIWPWLIQIGSRRAGWYSHDLLDNAGIPSSEELLPEFQHIAIDDFIPFTPDQKNGMWVKEFDPLGWILWWDKKEQSTWLWWLEPLDAEHTRLIARMRVRYVWTPPWLFYYLLFDAGDIVMMSKCLLGIKRRAENLHQSVAV